MTGTELRLSTALLSDALDRVGRSGCALGVRPLADGVYMMGAAFTVRYVAAGYPPGTVGDYIDDVPAGAVVVLDNGGRTDCTVWGDILTAVAHQRVAGTVIEGVNRDVDRALSLGYPIYSRGRYMRTGKDRVQVSGLQCPVTIGGVQVSPGDTVVGDSDGVVVLAADVVDEVRAMATEVAAKEDAILKEALSGVPLREARRRHGYHALQRATGKESS